MRPLSRRGRQVLDLLYRKGELSAAEIFELLPDLPSYSAARSILRSLEAQGLIRHRAVNLRYVYSARLSRKKASRKAMADLLDTFFDGSPEPALQSLMDISRDRGHELDLDRVQEMIDAARRDGR